MPAEYLRRGRVDADLPLDPAARAFFAEAFALAVRRRFRAGCAIAEITRSVAAAGTSLALPVLDAEMLVRAALGETVPVSDLPEVAVVTTRLQVFATLVDELALTADELDDLIRTAGAAVEPGRLPVG